MPRRPFSFALLLALACGAPPAETPPPASTGGDEVVATPVAATPEPEAPATEPVEASAETMPAEAAPTEAVPADPSAPLSDAARARLEALPNESIAPPPEFYFRTNERRHDLLANELANLGGAVVGVGSDQLYTLAAQTRASLIVGVDYDERVPMVHAIYSVLVPEAETPDALAAFFTAARAPQTRALLAERLASHPRKDDVLRLFDRYRDDWERYLPGVSRRVRQGVVGSWLADPGHYAHIRALFRAGRVHSRCGDLTGTTTVRAVGDALRELGVPVRVFYLSNADQFFPYGDGFKANFAALPTDERSLVVRTLRHPDLPNATNDRWHYVVQPVADLRARLETGAYPRSQLLAEDLIHARRGREGGFSRLDESVPAFVANRRAARANAAD
ncbi:MAG: hypothetical protein H6721_18945 [Sandaracinus sp.]|nr:hypothetical protein [Sandaracinus sp.]MCB9634205.1 hypothetical protein [Sandaracinus sp.]